MKEVYSVDPEKEAQFLMDLRGGPSIIQLVGVKEGQPVLPYIEGTRFAPVCECQAQNYIKQLCQVI